MQDSSRTAAAGPRSPAATAVSWTRGLADGGLSSWHLLAVGDFRAYFLSSVFSNLGTWLQGTAQTLLAFQLTHSAFGVGMITAGQFTGFLVLGPWAATIADRIGRRRVLISTQVVSGAVAGLLAILQVSHLMTQWWLLGLALVTGFAFTLALPVQNAMVSALAPPQYRKVALAMNSVSYNVGRMVSPLLYVVGLASLGYAWAFALNAVSFVLFALVVRGIYPRIYPPEIAEPVKPAPGWEGLRLIVRRPRIMLLLLMVAAVTVADDPVQVLGPSLAGQIPGGSALLPAYFLSALGVGTVLGTVLLPRSTASRHAAAPLLILAASIAVFAIGSSRWLSLSMAVVAGIAGLWTGAAAQAKLLETVRPEHWTQVMAYWAVAWAGTKPLASLLDGLLASRYSVLVAAMVVATPAAIVAVLELFLGDRSRDHMKSRMRQYNQAHASPQPHLPHQLATSTETA